MGCSVPGLLTAVISRLVEETWISENNFQFTNISKIILSYICYENTVIASKHEVLTYVK